jgi:HPt (histidine-containing phosphotransfer) domain-containing protein
MRGDPIVDIEALKTRVAGDSTLLTDIVHIFLASYREAMAKTRQAIVSSDCPGLEKAAHNLRGYLVNLHAKRASSVAMELELRGRRRDPMDAEALFSRLEREMVLLVPTLTMLCGIESAAASRIEVECRT